MKTWLNRLNTATWLIGWSLILGVMPSWAQTAALLPNAKQTFVDQNGAPLSNGTVTLTVPNTNTPKTTWQDSGETTPNTDPVVLDAAGRAVIYGQGNYQQTVKDSNGVQQWSAITTAYGASAPSGATGTDTAPLGTVMPWAGFAVPTNWLIAAGQPVSRTTYAQLLAAITIASTGISCTSSSTTLNGFIDTSQMAVGEPIEATCLSPGTTIATIPSANSVTVSAAATLTATVTATVFPWGNGNGVSTFNLPDLRGRTFAGADAMGGTAANRLTSTYYGASAAAPAIAGGNQSDAATTTLAQANLPNVNFTVVGTAAPQTITYANAPLNAGGSSAFVANGGSFNAVIGPGVLSISASSSAVTGTAASGGSGTPVVSANFGVIQPTITINYIVKALPNSSGAGGVVSFGGMIGDIICGVGLVCGPVGSPPVNTVSVSSSFGVTGPGSSTSGHIATWNNTLGSLLADSGGPPPATLAKVSHQFLDSYTSTTGLFTQSQPAFGDISGIIAVSQMPVVPASTPDSNFFGTASIIDGLVATVTPVALSGCTVNTGGGSYSGSPTATLQAANNYLGGSGGGSVGLTVSGNAITACSASGGTYTTLPQVAITDSTGSGGTVYVTVALNAINFSSGHINVAGNTVTVAGGTISGLTASSSGSNGSYCIFVNTSTGALTSAQEGGTGCTAQASAGTQALAEIVTSAHFGGPPATNTDIIAYKGVMKRSGAGSFDFWTTSKDFPIVSSSYLDQTGLPGPAGPPNNCPVGAPKLNTGCFSNSNFQEIFSADITPIPYGTTLDVGPVLSYYRVNTARTQQSGDYLLGINAFALNGNTTLEFGYTQWLNKIVSVGTAGNSYKDVKAAQIFSTVGIDTQALSVPSVVPRFEIRSGLMAGEETGGITAHCGQFALPSGGVTMADQGPSTINMCGNGTNNLGNAMGYYLDNKKMLTTQSLTLYANSGSVSFATPTTVSGTYTLPAAPPAGNGYSLTSTTAGVMSWTNVSGGSGTPCTTTALSLQYNAAGAFGCVAGVTSNGSNIVIASNNLFLGGSSSGNTILNATAVASGTATLPANTGIIAELNLAQTWSAAQSFNSSDLVLNGSSSGSTTLNASATASGTATLPANTGIVAELNLAQTWSAAQSFNSSDLILNGSSSGSTTLNASATASGTLTFPAATDTLVGKATTDTLTNKTITSNTDTLGTVTMSLGSDATGDTYYRDSGTHLARLAVGSAGQVLGNSGGLPAWVLSNLSASQGRLTLQSATPVMTTTQSAKTTVFLDCYKGPNVAVYNGTQATFLAIGSCEISMGLDAVTPHIASGSVYDVFAINNSGTLAICAGPAWSTTSTRGTGAGTTQIHVNMTVGFLTNQNSLTHCYGGASGTTDFGTVAADQGTYLGSLYATANGQTSFTFGAIGTSGGHATAGLYALYNYYNRVSIKTMVGDNAASWTWNTASWHQVNASAGMQTQFLEGVSEDAIDAVYNGETAAGTATNCSVGVGLDSTTAPSGAFLFSSFVGQFTQVVGRYEGVAPLGFHTLAALEFSSTTTGCTFYGTQGVSYLQSAMSSTTWQ